VTRTKRRIRRERLTADRLLERAGAAVGMPPRQVAGVLDAYAAVAGEHLTSGRSVTVPWFGVVAHGVTGGDDASLTLGDLLPQVAEQAGERPSTVALAVAGVTVEVERAFGRDAFVELPVVRVWSGRFGHHEPSHPVFGDDRVR
jgi:hypothetical protein